ncbi:MAG TPA: hypothetical protein VMF89_04980, partial [Polyangiales bacterium]|nr:hypothetical protein [Polyangiales bacterium]
MAKKLFTTLILVAATSRAALAQGTPDSATAQLTDSQGNPRAPQQPGTPSQIGPTVAPPAAEPPAAAPEAPAVPPEQAPAAATSEPPADWEPPLDVKFELQSIREDHQGLQTDVENFKFQWQRERDLHTAQTTRGLLITGVVQGRFGYIDQDTTNATVYGRRSGFDIGSAIVGFTGNLFRDYEEGRN